MIDLRSFIKNFLARRRWLTFIRKCRLYHCSKFTLIGITAIQSLPLRASSLTANDFDYGRRNPQCITTSDFELFLQHRAGMPKCDDANLPPRFFNMALDYAAWRFQNKPAAKVLSPRLAGQLAAFAGLTSLVQLFVLLCSTQLQCISVLYSPTWWRCFIEMQPPAESV